MVETSMNMYLHNNVIAQMLKQKPSFDSLTYFLYLYIHSTNLRQCIKSQLIESSEVTNSPSKLSPLLRFFEVL